MNKKKIYVIALILFAFYLLFANQIILFFHKDVRTKEVKFLDYHSNSEVTFSIDTGEEIGGLLEKYYIQGWAFCETEQDNSEKDISLLFKSISGNKCYVIDNKAQSRDDVYGVFREQKKIYSALNGLECQFSTINFKDGEYELFLYVWENESNYGFIETGMHYKKYKDRFTYLEQT